MTQRTFLFVESTRGPAYFELSDDPGSVVHKHKAAEMPDSDEALRTVMHEARTLGKISSE